MRETNVCAWRGRGATPWDRRKKGEKGKEARKEKEERKREEGKDKKKGGKM